MAKNEQFNRINQDVRRDYESAKKNYTDLLHPLNEDLRNSRTDDLLLRGYLTDKFKHGGPQRNNQGWFNLPEGGNTHYGARLRSGLLRQAYGGEGFGHDQAAINTWQDWRDTGGMDSGTVNELRRSGDHVVPGIYKNLENQMARRRSLQGGYSPGYDANTASMAREAARESARATDQNAGMIAGMRHQGKMFGTQGFDSYMKNMRAQDIQQRQFGLSGLSELEGRNLSAQLSLNQDDLSRANSLLSLYGSAPGASNAAYRNLFTNQGNMDNTNMNYLQLMAGMNPKSKSWWEHLIQGAGAGAGLISAFN